MVETGEERTGTEREPERYEAVLETIDDGVFIVDEEWAVEYANGSALDSADAALDEILGTPVMALAERMVVGSGVDQFESALRSVFADEGPFPKEVVLELDLATEPMIAEYRLSPRYEDGSVTGAVVVVRDVTERKRQERALRDLTEEYEAIFENTEDAIFLIDVERVNGGLEFRVERFNPAYESITGLTTERARGKTPRDLLGDDVGGEIEANYRRCVEAGEPITYEESLPMPEGEVIARTSLAPVVVDGEVTQIVGIARDVTERAKREETLRRREDQLAKLHDATRELLEADSPAAVAAVASDAADDVLDLPLNGIHFYDEASGGLAPAAVSDTSRELLGEIPVLDEGIAWEAFQHGEPRVHADIREAETLYDPETPMRSEIHLPLGEHGVFIVSSPEVDAFDDTDVDLARTLAANTEAALDRVTREQALRRREAELARKNDRLDEFASVVSHDLRNPLNAAMGRLELARDGVEGDHLDGAAAALDRMAALVEDLLTLAREGEAVGEPEPVDLPGLVESSWRHVGTDGATLSVEVEGTIRADPTRLGQLFENLFRNAVEHSRASDRDPTDGTAPAVTVTVGELPGGFYVADDGPGVPDDERDRVFDAGYSSTDGGTGFGLSIVEEVVDAHGWEIHLTESEADGARFDITGVTWSDPDR